MKLFRRTTLVIGFALSSPAFSQIDRDMAEFDGAIAEMRLSDVASIYGRIHDARLPAKGDATPDPTLDALAARLSLALGDPIIAQSLLRKPADGDESDRAERLLSEAQASLITGKFADAAAQFRLAGKAAKTEGQRDRARLGEAQVTLLTQPTQTPAMLAPLLTSKSPSWRTYFLAAQAALVLGDSTSAKRMAAAAMQAAGSSQVTDFAIMQVLQLQASIAAYENNLEQASTYLATIPNSDQQSSDTASGIADRAPACGLKGVTENDFVMIGLFTTSSAPIAIPFPLGASRAEVVQPFMESLAGYWKVERSVAVATGPIMMVRCRRTPAARYIDDQTRFDDAQWAADRHLRPRFLGEQYLKSPDILTAAGKAFDEIEKKVGPESSALIAPLYEMSMLSFSKMDANSSTLAVRALEKVERARAISSRLGGAKFPDFPKMTQFSPEVVMTTMRSWLKTADPAYAYAAVARFIDGQQIPASYRLELANLLAKRNLFDVTDRRYQALFTQRLRLAREAESGRDRDALLLEGKRYGTLCSFLPETPRVTDPGLTDSDYPRNAVSGEIAGATVIDMDVSKEGRIENYRILVEAPPLIFRNALGAAASRIKFDAARDANSRPTACKALRQNVRWRLPTGEEVPTLLPQSPFLNPGT